MVSALSPTMLPNDAPTVTWDTRRWPRSEAARWGVRLLLSTPLLVISVVAWRRDQVSAAHAVLIERAEVVGRDLTGLSAISDAYPPVPTLVAGVGGALLLSILSSLAAGCLAHAMAERLHQRRVPAVMIVVLLVGVVGVPSTVVASTQGFGQYASLALLATAIAGFVRFAFDRDTEGGFQAGLLLAAAFLFDPSAAVYVVCLGLAAPLLARHRLGGAPAAARAVTTVLLFPVVATIAGWVFLEWRFGGTVFHTVVDGDDLFGFHQGVLASLTDAGAEVLRSVARTPLYVVVGVLLASRRPIAALGYAIPLVGLLVSLWIGLAYPPVLAVLLLGLLALMTAPFEPSRPVLAVLAAAAVAQLVIGVVWVAPSGILTI